MSSIWEVAKPGVRTDFAGQLSERAIVVSTGHHQSRWDHQLTPTLSLSLSNHPPFLFPSFAIVLPSFTASLASFLPLPSTFLPFVLCHLPSFNCPFLPSPSPCFPFFLRILPFLFTYLQGGIVDFSNPGGPNPHGVWKKTALLHGLQRPRGGRPAPLERRPVPSFLPSFLLSFLCSSLDILPSVLPISPLSFPYSFLPSSVSLPSLLQGTTGTTL